MQQKRSRVLLWAAVSTALLAIVYCIIIITNPPAQPPANAEIFPAPEAAAESESRPPGADAESLARALVRTEVPVEEEAPGVRPKRADEPMDANVISGRVVNHAGVPVANARVLFTLTRDTENVVFEAGTNASGWFVFQEMSADAGYLDAAAPNGNFAKSYYFARRADVYPVELVVDDREVPGITVKIKNRSGSAAALAEVYKLSKKQNQKFVANRAGYCRVPARAAASLLILDADHECRATERRDVTPEAREIEVFLAEEAPSTKLVIRGLSNYLTSAGSGGKAGLDCRVALMDESSRVTIGNLDYGNWIGISTDRFHVNFERAKLYAWAPGYEVQEVMTLESRDLLPKYVIDLRSVEPVRGIVDIEGKPAAGAVARLYQFNQLIDETTSAADGTFSLYPMGEGKVKVVVGPQGGSRGDFTNVSMDDISYRYHPGSDPIPFHLRANGGLDYYLSTRDGAWISGRRITILGPDGFHETIATNVRGKAEFRGLAPARYWIRRDPEIYDTENFSRKAGDVEVNIESGKIIIKKIVCREPATVRTELYINGERVSGFRGCYLSDGASVPFGGMIPISQMAPMFINEARGEFDSGRRELRILHDRIGEFEIAFRKRGIDLARGDQSYSLQLHCGAVEGTLERPANPEKPEWIFLQWTDEHGLDACGSVLTFGPQNQQFRFPVAPEGKCRISRRNGGGSAQVRVKAGETSKVNL